MMRMLSQQQQYIYMYPPVLDTFCTTHIHNILIVGVGNDRHINWLMLTPGKAAPVTGTTLRTVVALHRRTLDSERHRYANA